MNLLFFAPRFTHNVRMQEFELIKNCFSNWTQHNEGVAVGIGDDCLIWLAGQPLTISVDTSVVGRHFPVDASPEQVAQRAFLPALSDLAAMGATPAFFTLALTLPAALNNEWIVRFADRLRSLAQQYQIMLAGGDTTRGESLTITIAVHGTCAHPLLRSGAVVGDDIWVSGTLGQAAAALPSVIGTNEQPVPDAWLAAYWLPQPRIGLAQQLVGIVHSAMDLSDGLVGDAEHIAKASAVDLHIEVTQVPRDDALLELGDAGLQYALAGGDDYELLLTASPQVRHEIATIARQIQTPLTRIGEVKEGTGAVHWYQNGQPITLDWQGFQHF